MIKDKIERLLDLLSQGALEREEAIGLSLLSAAAGESIFLLGLPGVAKSMIARRLSLAFKDARRFEYLMSRFSTPDEIFGPVSISKLKDCDSYERVTDGYLPSSEVVFLDEIWKAGPAIQNSLLTAINEKIFRNGRQDMKLPLRAIIAASNELPSEGEGLEALWDRFLVRYIVEPLKDKGNFFSLLDGTSASVCEVPDEVKITPSEMDSILEERDSVIIPAPVMEFMYALRSKYSEDVDPEMEEDRFPYVSDRRWKKIAGLMKTSALLNGRDSVDWSDCLLLEHLLWDKDSQTGLVKEDVAKGIIDTLMKDASAGTSQSIWKKKAPSEDAPMKFWSPDQGVHLAFEAAGELMYITREDYDHLGSKALYGRFDADNVVHVSEESAEFTIRSTRPGTLTINSFTYPLRLERGSAAGGGAFFNEVIASTRDRVEDLSQMVEDNIFTRGFSQYKELGKEVRRYQGSFNNVKSSR